VLGELVEQHVDEPVGIAPALPDRALVDPAPQRDPRETRLIAVLDQLVPGRADDLPRAPRGCLPATEDHASRIRAGVGAKSRGRPAGALVPAPG
jgi:hypothetical protein